MHTAIELLSSTVKACIFTHPELLHFRICNKLQCYTDRQQLTAAVSVCVTAPETGVMIQHIQKWNKHIQLSKRRT